MNKNWIYQHKLTVHSWGCCSALCWCCSEQWWYFHAQLWYCHVQQETCPVEWAFYFDHSFFCWARQCGGHAGCLANCQILQLVSCKPGHKVGRWPGLAVVCLPFPAIEIILILKRDILNTLKTQCHIYLCALEAESVRAGKIFGLERLVIKSVVTDAARRQILCLFIERSRHWNRQCKSATFKQTNRKSFANLKTTILKHNALCKRSEKANENKLGNSSATTRWGVYSVS